MTMLAPWRASSRTIAWPIPLLPPVTIAILFFSDMIRVLDAIEPLERPSSTLNRLSRQRFRRRDLSGFFVRKLSDQIRHQPGPTGLVRGAAAAAIVAMKVFMEKNVVLEMRIGLKFFVAAEHWAPAVGAALEELEQAAAQLIGNLIEGQHDARAGRAFDLESFAVEQVEPPQTLDQQIIDRHPDR